MIKLTPFRPSDFATFISWLDNEELLFQIAGKYFTFPLTNDQLQNYLDDEKSIAFNVVDLELDKIIIGDPSMRGKRLGGQLIEALKQHAFSELKKWFAKKMELNEDLSRTIRRVLGLP